MSDVDREIDRAVHAMLPADAAPDLRDRVLLALKESGAASKPRNGAGGRRWTWALVPVAAAAVVVVAVLLGPSAPSPIASRAVVARVEPPAVHATEAADHLTPTRGVPFLAEESPRTDAGGRTAAARGVRPPPDALLIEIAPLEAPAPIAVAGVEPSPIERPEVRIAGLPPIAPIAIEPLSAQGGRH